MEGNWVGVVLVVLLLVVAGPGGRGEVIKGKDGKGIVHNLATRGSGIGFF